MAEEKDWDCDCEDPYNVGERLRLCGQAVCWRLKGLIPQPSAVHEGEGVIINIEEDE